MASRRLDISSLLCDDPPPFSPLDALVHAATEERRKLTTDPPPPPQLPHIYDLQRGGRFYDHDYEQRRKYDEQQRELERREREFQRREAERRDFERAREIERQLAVERRELAERQQRDAIELERRREHEFRMRQQLLLDARTRYPIVTAPHPPSISHLISHPLQPDRPPHHPTVIPLEPHTIAIPPPPHEDPRPIKKRRYSESPTRPIPDDKERIARERDKMLVGELGYGRTDSPIAGPSHPHPPRRPGSGHDHTRKVAVADLLTVDSKERSISSDREAAAHRVLSPLGRRSPPGSQIGRAKAARKSDEHLLREPPPVAEPKPKEEPPKIKQEPKPAKPHESVRSPVVDDHRNKKLVVKEAPPPKSIIVPKAQQDDSDEWFLQQLDEGPSPTTSARHEPPHTPSPSISPVVPVAVPPIAKTPPRALTPVVAAVSLEEELEELVSDPLPASATTSTIVKKQDPDIDMEVDLAVTELVDTLEADDNVVKHEPKKMDVDVEDELLSLLDDTPKLAPASASTARRNPPSSAAPPSSSSHGSAPTPSSHAHAHTHSHAAPKPAPHHNQNSSASEPTHVSPPVAGVAAAAVSPATAAARHPSTRPTSERGSMPPPATTAGPGKKGVERAGSAVPSTGAVTGAAPAKKKKETKTAAAKSKNAAVPPTPATAAPPAAKKARPPAKSKKGTANAVDSASATPPAPGRGPKGPGTGPARKTAPSTSRSRSTSVMPGRGASAGPESDAVKADKQEDDESDAGAGDDDKLYCVCKTRYDEDRFMIACDRCDEWYHTQCVAMPDLEVDLVDQFICPLCIEKNPNAQLRTTYKTRCLYGLRAPDPDSPRACHKAARGAFSKYCSDECGVKYMQSRVDSWAKKGGRPEKLWESVKGAEKREGVVCAVERMESEEEEEHKPAAADMDKPKPTPNGTACVKMEVDGAGAKPAPVRSATAHVKMHVVPPTKTKAERETERLRGVLDGVIRQREDVKRGMEAVVWRERVLQLAGARAEAVGQCGWDQRLCMDDQEWVEAGASVLESYEEAMARVESGDDMEVDGGEEQWWCPGKQVCDRHQGWLAVRLKDVCKEKEKAEEVLAKLTTRERELRKRIEDILDPQTTNNPANGANGASDAVSHAPLKNSTKALNGHSKTKAAASAVDGQKKGKKRKAPAS